MATKTVGVRDLKNDAPALVRRAERGEQFVITRHGRPAARLGPAEPAPEPPAAGADCASGRESAGRSNG